MPSRVRKSVDWGKELGGVNLINSDLRPQDMQYFIMPPPGVFVEDIVIWGDDMEPHPRYGENAGKPKINDDEKGFAFHNGQSAYDVIVAAKSDLSREDFLFLTIHERAPVYTDNEDEVENVDNYGAIPVSEEISPEIMAEINEWCIQRYADCQPELFGFSRKGKNLSEPQVFMVSHPSGHGIKKAAKIYKKEEKKNERVIRKKVVKAANRKPANSKKPKNKTRETIRESHFRELLEPFKTDRKPAKQGQTYVPMRRREKLLISSFR